MDITNILKWLSDNKEWLFSGSGVSVIIVIIYVIRYFKNKRLSNSSVNISQATKDVIEKPIAQILPNQIYENVKNLPPLQQEDAFNHYKGLRVEWKTRLASAFRQRTDPSQIRLHLSYTSKPYIDYYIFCYVNANDNNNLAVAKKDSLIQVIGEIVKVDMMAINLINCKVILLPEPMEEKTEIITQINKVKSPKRLKK